LPTNLDPLVVEFSTLALAKIPQLPSSVTINAGGVVICLLGLLLFTMLLWKNLVSMNELLEKMNQQATAAVLGPTSTMTVSFFCFHD
jgi:hypothetical protein